MFIDYKTGGKPDSVNRLHGAIKKKVRNYLEIDVLEAAIERVKFLFSNYDNVVVAFSGGKDSLVLLELIDKVRIDLGITKKLTLFFFDEELISNEHAAFMDKIYKSGRFDFRWVCAPLRSEKYILGHNYPYIQWDITREFLRPMPEYAIDLTNEPPSSEHEIFTKHFKNEFSNLVYCLGLRAAESLNRLNSIFVSNNHDRPFIAQDEGYAKGKPIYDWSEKDIFKFISDNKLEYAPVYDAQTWGLSKLRVATPFTNEGAKHLDLLKAYDPPFYNRLIQIFPEMAVQERYYAHLDKNAVFTKYGISKEGILAYVEENLYGRSKEKCMKCLDTVWTRREADYANGEPISVYPLLYVFKSVVNGAYKRTISPIAPKHATPEMILYDNKAKELAK